MAWMTVPGCGVRKGLGSFSETGAWGCPVYPFEHEANCRLSAVAITQNSKAPLSTQFPHSLIHCRITSKNDRLPASLSSLSRTLQVMPTLDWKPEANDVIIPCVAISNPLPGSLTLNISQNNGPIRCRKKHSKSFILQQPFF